MRLTDLRAYVANILDYSPEVEAYKTQIDSILNDAYRRLFSEKPFTFAQKDKVIKAKTDVKGTIGATLNNTEITAAAPFFTDDMAGQVISLDDVEYTIAWIFNTTVAHLTTSYTASTGNKSGVVKYRYLDFPQDMVSCLQVIKRSMDLTPQEPGRMIPLSRYEDEWYNLPLNEVNLPHYWVPYDDYYTQAPRIINVAAFVSGVGHGTRTLEFAMSYVFAGRESALSKPSTITLADNQIARVTFGVALPNGSGIFRRVYVRNVTAGWKAYRLIPSTINQYDQPPPMAATADYNADSFNDDFGLTYSRHTEADGNRQRFRLYPRQSADYEITIRYIYRPPELIEDNDTPEFPSASHPILAYMALREVFVKHDNTAQAAMYDRKVNIEMLKMEQRYLTEKPRRWVKQAMGSAGLDVLPIYTPLVHS